MKLNPVIWVWSINTLKLMIPLVFVMTTAKASFYMDGVEGCKSVQVDKKGASADVCFEKGYAQGRVVYKRNGRPVLVYFYDKGERVGGWHHYYEPNRYQGDFDHLGRRSGQGDFWWSSSPFYKGSWKDDVPHGRGAMVLEAGGSYVGDFIYGRRTGEGVYASKEGVVYSGSWLNGRWHGKGTLINGPTNLFSTFYRGSAFGQSVIYFSDGSAWYGELERDIPVDLGRCQPNPQTFCGRIIKNNAQTPFLKWEH